MSDTAKTGIVKKRMKNDAYLKREAARKHASYRAMFLVGARNCVICGAIYQTDLVISRGWKLFGRHSTICDLCFEEEEH